MTDPLIAKTPQAASALISVADSAASVIGGKVSGWLAHRKDNAVRPTEILPPTPPMPVETNSSWLDLFTRDNQSPEVVAKVAEKVQAITMSDEQLTFVAVQNKPLVNWMPDCLALTNKRFIFFRPKLLGQVSFEDYVWRELHDAQLSEEILGSTITIKSASGTKLSLDSLPQSTSASDLSLCAGNGGAVAR